MADLGMEISISFGEVYRWTCGRKFSFTATCGEVYIVGYTVRNLVVQ